MRLYNRSACAKKDAEATKLWLCYIIRVVQWLLLKETDSICPHLMFALGSPVTSSPIRKNTIFWKWRVSAKENGMEPHRNDPIPPPPCLDLYWCRPLQQIELLLASTSSQTSGNLHVFHGLFHHPHSITLNTIMVSTLVDWLCCYRQPPPPLLN